MRLVYFFFLPGLRLYHTVTSLPGGGIVVYGGRSSPLNPIGGLLRVTLGFSGQPGPLGSEDGDIVKLSVEQMVCTGDPPPARWRHTVTVVSHKGEMKKGSFCHFMPLIHSYSLFLYCTIKPCQFSFRQRLPVSVWRKE